MPGLSVRLNTGFIFFSAITAALGQNSTWYIDTIAGTTRPVLDGGPATSAILNTPSGLVIDSGGNVIFADTNNYRVRKIAPDGSISTLAGNGLIGYSGDSGAASAAELITPKGLALDSSGNLYISDYNANVVRQVTPSGTITTIAGTGIAASSGDFGPATAAALNGPYGLAVRSDGTLVIADYFNSTLRTVSSAGIISRLPSVTNPAGMVFDAAGNLYVSAQGQNQLFKISPSGLVSVVAGNGTEGFAGDGAAANLAMIDYPAGVGIDSAGNIWFADSRNNRIRQIGTDGVIRTMIGSGNGGYNSPGSDPTKLNVDQPDGLCIDNAGNVYWTEANNHRVRKYNPTTKVVTELAGTTPPLTTSGAPTTLLLFNPSSAATDSAGNLYIADTSNNVIRKILPSGVSSIVAGTGAAGFNRDSGPATTLQLSYPQGVAVDTAGNLLIADSGNSRVRRVDASGNMTTIMGAGSYLPLTGTTAGEDALIFPVSITAATAKGFYVVDQYFQVVIHVDAYLAVTLLDTTSLGYLSLPAGAAPGPNGSVYIADTYNNRILHYTANGAVSIFAGTGAPGFQGDGSAATHAKLFLPYGVAVDSANNVYIADSGNSRIRQVNSSGIISTIAGTGHYGFSGDKGIATAAQISFPTSLNITSTGDIEFADLLNQRIRKLHYQPILADLSMSVDSQTKSVNIGNPVTVRLTLSSNAGVSGPVTLAVTGAPAGVTFQFSPAATVAVAGGQTVLVSATAQLPATLTLGTSTLTFTATGGSGSGLVQSISTVILNVTNLPQITTGGIVSAASYSAAGVSPGEIIAIFGQGFGPASLVSGTYDANNVLPQSLAGTRVLFDGNPAPLIYCVSGQLAAIVPYEVAGQTTTRIQVEFNGQQSPASTVTVLAAAPALFNAGSGSQAAALNQDNSVNTSSNPAPAGTEIVLFGTGEGSTSGGVDGKLAIGNYPVPLLPITVTIGGEPVIVDYAAAAPYEVAGVFQINARIPADLPSGPAAVVVTVGTNVSTGTSTIAIK